MFSRRIGAKHKTIPHRSDGTFRVFEENLDLEILPKFQETVLNYPRRHSVVRFFINYEHLMYVKSVSYTHLTLPTTPYV